MIEEAYVNKEDGMTWKEKAQQLQREQELREKPQLTKIETTYDERLNREVPIRVSLPFEST